MKFYEHPTTKTLIRMNGTNNAPVDFIRDGKLLWQSDYSINDGWLDSDNFVMYDSQNRSYIQVNLTQPFPQEPTSAPEPQVKRDEDEFNRHIKSKIDFFTNRDKEIFVDRDQTYLYGGTSVRLLDTQYNPVVTWNAYIPDPETTTCSVSTGFGTRPAIFQDNILLICNLNKNWKS